MRRGSLCRDAQVREGAPGALRQARSQADKLLYAKGRCWQLGSSLAVGVPSLLFAREILSVGHSLTRPEQLLHGIDTRIGDDARRGDVMTVRLTALADRRANNRLPTPTCSQCGDGHLMVGIIRTTRFVYFRCPTCGELQPKMMPALALAHGLVAHLSE